MAVVTAFFRPASLLDKLQSLQRKSGIGVEQPVELIQVMLIKADLHFRQILALLLCWYFWVYQTGDSSFFSPVCQTFSAAQVGEYLQYEPN